MPNALVPAAATGLPETASPHDANLRSGKPPHSGARPGPNIATLAAAVRALDARFAAEPMPDPLAPAMRLARALVAAQAAGVPVTDGELVEAAAALAGALRQMRERETRI